MRRRLGEILISLGHVQPSHLEDALKVQSEEPGRRLGEILLMGGLGEDALMEALSVQSGVPLMRGDRFPDTMPVDKVSFDFLRRSVVLPLSLGDGTLEVAIADPWDREALDALASTFDYEIKPFLAGQAAITANIERIEGSKDVVIERLLDDVTEDTGPIAGDLVHLRDLAQDQGIISLVDLIIDNAVKENASDIHVEPEETLVRVRYRIDGILYDREALPLKTQAALASRIKLLSQMNIAERRLPQDGRIRSRHSGKEVDIRVSTIPTVHGESIVMRLLDRDASFIGLTELGFGEKLITKYLRLIGRPYGMVLITGPTGSGKTTTLYASLDRINSPEKKIITIEEPVEYMLSGITQIHVRPRIGLTFASGLRHIVRQDPDIIMVGEIRDVETASIGVHAALTGHLLFSTLHTNDAASAVTRLLDMGVENYLVASTLGGVMAQRLVRRVCPSCAETYPVPPELRAKLGESPVNLSRGRGCAECMNTGFKGRVAIFELMVVEESIRDLITEGAYSAAIKEKAVSLGMQTLYDDGIEKVKQGITTMDELLRVTQVQA